MIASKTSKNRERKEGNASTGYFDTLSLPGRLSLNAAGAPLFPCLDTPFGRAERKRAHAAAVFYSECFLRGIGPTIADIAVVEAQGKYRKWWINSTALRPVLTQPLLTKRSCVESNVCRPEFQCSKRRKPSKVADQDEESIISANVVSVASPMSHKMVGQRFGINAETEDIGPVSVAAISTLGVGSKIYIQTIKSRLVEDLKSSGGNVTTSEFLECLEILEVYYRSKSWDGRGSSRNSLFSLEGNWLTLSKPTYNECKGKTTKGEYMYTIGRMSFDMFKPTNMVCSIQAAFNQVRTIDPLDAGKPLHVPKKLLNDMAKGDVNLRTHDIVVAFTIESGQDRKGNRESPHDDGYAVPYPIRGILTNHGYSVPDPEVPNRLSIWFSGGSIEVQDEPRDLNEWRKIFDSTRAPDRDLREYANILAARLLLGALLPEDMEDDGTMSFVLKRPIGGHGSAYCDIIYMDNDLRIMRGHHGSVYVCTRVPELDQIICG